ncbi:MAG: ATP synthase F1 subunit gamma [Candidatus Aminicenantales bacterium]
MPALIDLRRRIKSVRNTQQITQAMKTVSSAKFRKAQRLVLEGRPYFRGLSGIVEHVALWAEWFYHPLFEEREEKHIEGLVVTSDKGLCGAFNSNLLEQTISFFHKKAEAAKVSLVLVGKKALLRFRKEPFPVEMSFRGNVDKLSHEDMRKISVFLKKKFILKKVDAVYIAYNEFRSILSPKIKILRLLPLVAPEVETGERLIPPAWEPEAFGVVNSLLPHFVDIFISHIFQESQAAEHAARMMAMDNATKNAEELIEDLTLVLNKVRQASITKELLEIMTAVEALSEK